jgi:aryl-phospho-beta-D-glucosidase BglC (GH1 family)
MVGEWCLEPMSPASSPATPQERQAYHRALADAQLAAWDGGARAWFFWSYKLLAEGPSTDGWDLRRSVELGYLPTLDMHRTNVT